MKRLSIKKVGICAAAVMLSLTACTPAASGPADSKPVSASVNSSSGVMSADSWLTPDTTPTYGTEGVFNTTRSAAVAQRNTRPHATESNGYAAVPEVTKCTEEEAVRLLKEAGFQAISVYGYYGDDWPDGTVYLQSHPCHTAVLRGTTVILCVHSLAQKPNPQEGTPYIQLPSVQGKTEAAARQELEKLGLKASIVRLFFGENIADGTVFFQSHPAGTLAVPKAEVVLYVQDMSKQPAIPTTKPTAKPTGVTTQTSSTTASSTSETFAPYLAMPNVIGWPIEKAESYFRERGFQLEIQYAYYYGAQEDGEIFSQYPSPNFVISRDMVIQLSVNDLSLNITTTEHPTTREYRPVENFYGMDFMEFQDRWMKDLWQHRNFEIVYADGSELPEGQIFDQQPKAGTLWDREERIYIYVQKDGAGPLTSSARP